MLLLLIFHLVDVRAIREIDGYIILFDCDRSLAPGETRAARDVSISNVFSEISENFERCTEILET